MAIVRRDFFLGFGTGVLASLLLLVAGAASLILIAKRATRNLPNNETALYELKGEPVGFVMISDEDAETVAAYIEKGHFSFPVYLAHERRPRVFQDLGIPVTFVLTPSGMVVFKQVAPSIGVPTQP